MPSRGYELDRFLVPRQDMEMREGEPEPEIRNVVRAFLLQGRTRSEVEEQIKKGVDLADLSFTDSIWLLKTGKENPGQLMPVGGKIEKPDMSDNILDGLTRAVKREMLQETHLRVVSLQSVGRQNYSFQHTQKGEISNNAFLFTARILPSDVPYPLDPEEDKFNKFVSLDIGQVGELLHKGRILGTEGREMKLLDSFILDDETRAEIAGTSATQIDKDVTAQSLARFAEQMSSQEAKTKIEIMHKLFFILRQKPSDDLENKIKDWEEALSKAKNLFSVQLVYQEMMYSGFVSSAMLLEAISLTNLEEEINYMDDSESKVLLHFMSVLSTEKNWTDEYFEIVSKNEYLRDFLKKMSQLLDRLGFELEDDLVGNESIYNHLLRIHSLKDKGDISEDDEQVSGDSRIVTEKEVSQALGEVFGLHYTPKELSRDADSFIDNIAKSALLPHIDKRYGTAGGFLLNEISEASLLDLLKISIYNPNDKWLRDRFPSPKIRQQAIFEARRKLILMLTIDGVKKFYTETIEEGNSHFYKMWGRLISGPNQDNVRYCVEKYGKKKDEKGGEEDILLDVEITDEKPPAGVGFKTTSGRTFQVDDGELLVESQESVKTLDSTIRKHIVLGIKNPEEISDIYRRSLTVLEKRMSDGSKGVLTELQELEIESGEIDYRFDKSGQGGEPFKKIVIRDVSPVIEIIRQILEKGQGRIKILSFRPSDKMSTFGPGGNRNLRFAKFYLQYTEEGGRPHFEEVQIFVPQPNDDRSAVYFHDAKVLDDHEYELSRLTDTRGRRSFVGNLYPPLIYGDPIRALAKQSFKKINRR